MPDDAQPGAAAVAPTSVPVSGGARGRVRSEAGLALACLTHPWTLCALAVLGLNDHWWKGVGPAWLTGKLSDVAGLWLFPFLLTAAVAALVRSRRTAGLPVARGVFVAVGLWFAAAKILPGVHRVTVELARAVLGPVEVIRDPGDALAVLVLVPAWLLYRREAGQPARPVSQVLRLPVVCVAVLLTAATSQPRVPSVNQLEVHGDTLYAGVGDRPGNHASLTFYATTDGTTWHPAAPPGGLFAPGSLRTEVTGADGRTFRAEGPDIRVSDDEGWRTAWRISKGRREYMFIAGGQWWHVRDMARLPGDAGVIVAALETEGVAVRAADGTWTRHAVGPVRPSAERASAVDVARLMVRGQWAFGAAAAVMVWIVSSLLTWCAAPLAPVPSWARVAHPGLWARLRSRAAALVRGVSRLHFDCVYPTCAVVGLVLPCLVFLLYLTPLRLSDSILPPSHVELAVLVSLGVSLLPVAWGWRRYKRRTTAHDEPVRKPYGDAAAGGLAALAALALWDLGWVDSLPAAFYLAVVAMVVIVLRRTAAMGHVERDVDPECLDREIPVA